MNDNIFLLQIPSFTPRYLSNVKYGYGQNKKADNLRSLLYQTSFGYCMYCYTKIHIDGKYFGHLEHAVEKNISKKLVQCTPNIGLACPVCNTRFKKVKEVKKDDINVSVITKFEAENCIKSKCRKACREYNQLKRCYLKKRNIILQPIGVKVNKKEYIVEYDILHFRFRAHNQDRNARKFIENHIEIFHLNDAEYRTKELLKFCCDVINGNNCLVKGRYQNLLVDLFIEKINKFDRNTIFKICKSVYLAGKMQHVI